MMMPGVAPPRAARGRLDRRAAVRARLVRARPARPSAARSPRPASASRARAGRRPTAAGGRRTRTCVERRGARARARLARPCTRSGTRCSRTPRTRTRRTAVMLVAGRRAVRAGRRAHLGRRGARRSRTCSPRRRSSSSTSGCSPPPTRARSSRSSIPVARGSAPVIVLVVSVAALGVALSGLQAAGVLAVAAGRAARPRPRPRRRARDLALALAVGACIAGYTLVDDHGLRHAAPDRRTSTLVLVVAAVPYAAVVGPAAMRRGADAARAVLARGRRCSAPTCSRSPRSSAPRRRPWRRCARRAWSWRWSAPPCWGASRVPAARVVGACVGGGGRCRDRSGVTPANVNGGWVGVRGAPAARRAGVAQPAGRTTAGFDLARRLPRPLPSRSRSEPGVHERARGAGVASTTERARTQVRSRRGGTFSSTRTTAPSRASQIRSSGKRIVNVCTDQHFGMCSATVAGIASSFARPFRRAARVCASATRSPPGRSRPGRASRRVGS